MRYQLLMLTALASCGPQTQSELAGKRCRSEHQMVSADVSAEFLRRGARARFTKFEQSLMVKTCPKTGVELPE